MKVSTANNIIVTILFIVAGIFLVTATQKSDLDEIKCVSRSVSIVDKKTYRVNKMLRYVWICNDGTNVSAGETEWYYSKIGDSLFIDKNCNRKRK